MTTEQSESNSDRQPIPAYILPYPARDDEVSLIDLWRVLVRRKLIILVILVLALIFASVHLLTIQPVYTASARLAPPEIGDIKALLLGEPETWMVTEEGGRAVGYNVNKSLLGKYGLEAITPISVFQSYVQNYNSAQVRSQFSDSANPINFRISDIDSKNPIAIASLSHRDPEYAASQLNEYVKFVDRYTARKIVENIRLVIQIELEKISRELAVRFGDALELPGKDRGLETEAESPEISNAIASDVDRLQERLTYLKSLSIDHGAVSVIRIDSSAHPPSTPDKSNKRVVLSMAVVLGLFLGVLTAFFAEFINKVRQQA